jgi:putative ribosome biogenesis GTPase RsgA
VVVRAPRLAEARSGGPCALSGRPLATVLRVHHATAAANLSNSAAARNPREGETQMSVQVGDRIVVESERASQPSRAGVIEEVLHEDPSRVRVRWEDGHTSILSPSAGVASIIPQTTRTTS